MTWWLDFIADLSFLVLAVAAARTSRLSGHEPRQPTSPREPGNNGSWLGGGPAGVLGAR